MKKGTGLIWEYKDDKSEKRVYLKGTGISGSTKTIRGYMEV